MSSELDSYKKKLWSLELSMVHSDDVDKKCTLALRNMNVLCMKNKH